MSKANHKILILKKLPRFLNITTVFEDKSLNFDVYPKFITVSKNISFVSYFYLFFYSSSIANIGVLLSHKLKFQHQSKLVLHYLNSEELGLKPIQYFTKRNQFFYSQLKRKSLSRQI